jgi:hypothetical protein
MMRDKDKIIDELKAERDAARKAVDMHLSWAASAGSEPDLMLRELNRLSDEFPLEVVGEDGWTDWIHPMNDYRMACCDCGLVHNIEFRLDDLNQLNFRMQRARNQRLK